MSADIEFQSGLILKLSSGQIALQLIVPKAQERDLLDALRVRSIRESDAVIVRFSETLVVTVNGKGGG